MSKYRILLDGKTYEMEIERIDGAVPAPAKKEEPEAKAAPVPPQPVRTAAAEPQSAAGNAVTSPMPGTILRVNVSAGDIVKQGQGIMVLEAMKMENEISAPKAGRITVLHVKQGDSVQGGDALFEIGE